jgi:hypothetical protein
MRKGPEKRETVFEGIPVGQSGRVQMKLSALKARLFLRKCMQKDASEGGILQLELEYIQIGGMKARDRMTCMTNEKSPEGRKLSEAFEMGPTFTMDQGVDVDGTNRGHEEDHEHAGQRTPHVNILQDTKSEGGIGPGRRTDERESTCDVKSADGET